MIIFKKAIRYFFTLAFILPAFSAKSQMDLKNSLRDLLRKYSGSQNNVTGVQNALSIGNFYLNNKGNSMALDSSLTFCKAAEDLSVSIHYEKGMEDAQALKAQVWIAQGKIATVTQMAISASGNLYCRLNLLLGKYYLEKPGSEKEDIDLSEGYLIKAETYANKYKMTDILITAQINRYKLLRERGMTINKSEAFFDKTIGSCKIYLDNAMEAQAWVAKANYAETVDQKAKYYLRASQLASAARDTGLFIWAQKEIADITLQKGELNLAEAQLLHVLKLYTDAGYQNLQFTYDLLIAVMIKKGSYEVAMRYGLAAVTCAEKTGTDIGLSFFQYRLTRLCLYLGQKKESIYWAKECLKSSEQEGLYPYGVYLKVERERIAAGQAKQVLSHLPEMIKRHPPKLIDDFFALSMLKGDCYAALHDRLLANRNYSTAAGLVQSVPVNTGAYFGVIQALAEAYVKENEYQKASVYVTKLLKAPNGIIDISDQVEIHNLKFKVDSASGSYVDAIRHFEASKRVTDSIFDHVRLRQTEELQFQFKTAQKDRENLILRNRNNLQRSDLEKESLEKKMIGIGLLASVLILGLMFYLYRVKQRSNKYLQKQRNEINLQNMQLNQLLGEKEWLIKEIHHRVKNNLQIISSLLNTQSAYLENSEAQAAIRDSQNRMHAIAIVHQRLYQSNDLTRVSFSSYLRELVQSICDSFQSDVSIEFGYDVMDVYLNTAESVPIGLMLNEAITNSIKYAFKETLHPKIFISLTGTSGEVFELTIRDNGTGLPDDFDIDSCTSLGINLMAGLAEQLSGKFYIRSDGGTIITVIFKRSTSDA
jgi:two-component sensor histidine kinase